MVLEKKNSVYENYDIKILEEVIGAVNFLFGETELIEYKEQILISKIRQLYESKQINYMYNVKIYVEKYTDVNVTLERDYDCFRTNEEELIDKVFMEL